MEARNFKEYELLRNELHHLKECMTAYIRIVLGGVGAALYFLVTTEHEGASGERLADASIALAIVVSLVLLILLYKFNSHNRYAGYCKMLLHERVKLHDSTPPAPLVAWEICMDRLRDESDGVATQSYADVTIELDDHPEIKTLDDLEKHVADLTQSTSLGAAILGGFGALGRIVFRGRTESDSWRYPVYVVLVFAALVSMLVAISLTLVPGWPAPNWCVGVALLAFAWCQFMHKLHGVMYGADRVDMYCWRFLGVRCRFVRSLADGAITYRVVGARAAPSTTTTKKVKPKTAKKAKTKKAKTTKAKKAKKAKRAKA